MQAVSGPREWVCNKERIVTGKVPGASENRDICGVLKASGNRHICGVLKRKSKNASGIPTWGKQNLEESLGIELRGRPPVVSLAIAVVLGVTLGVCGCGSREAKLEVPRSPVTAGEEAVRREPQEPPSQALGISPEKERQVPPSQVVATPLVAQEQVPETARQPGPPSSQEEAMELLRKVVEAYKTAPGYRDKGYVEVRAEIQGQQRVMMSGDYMVCYARPNRFRLQCYNGVVVSDGEYMYGITVGLPQQVLRRPAPAGLDIAMIYSDLELARAMVDGPTRPASWMPIPLVLLAAQDPLKTLLFAAQPPRLLTPQRIDEALCDRVVFERPDGALILWIDRADLVVRRVEFPTVPLAAMFPPQQVRNLQIVAELVEAALEPPPDDQPFQFTIPEGAEVVEDLQPPFLRWLGQTLPDFEAVTLEGKPLTAQELSGKLAVIELWTTWCGNCRESLPLVERVYQLYKESEQIQFWAISLDEAAVSDLDLQNVFNSLKVTIPIARDPKGTLVSKLGISGIPTLVLVDAKGVIQYMETGVRPDLGEQLRLRIERVLAGENVYREPLEIYERELNQFQEVFAKCLQDDLYVFPGALEPTPEGPRIVPRSEPKHHRLEALWVNSDVKEPGNILVLPGDSGGWPRVYVISEGKRALEIGADGKVISAVSLTDQEDSPIHFLRWAVDGSRNLLFAGWTSPGLEVTVFDASWKPILVFPPNARENPHPGIGDVRFADLDEDGNLELVVGYWNVVGVQYVSLEGKRIWSNRSLTDALRILVFKDEKEARTEIWAMDTRGGVGGAVARLDKEGRRVGQIAFADRVVVWLYGADLDPDGCTDVCLLTFDSRGTLAAVGVDADGEILWEYQVPMGLHLRPVEPLTHGPITPEPPAEWVVAAADGSLHWLSKDGSLVDSFAYGKEICGLAVLSGPECPVLLVSTPDGVEAWQIRQR